MAMPPLDLLPPTVAVKRVAWGVRVGRALASPAALSPKRAARPQPPHFAPVKATPWLAWDVLTAGYIVAVHLLACAAPFTYTPSALRCFVVTYVLSGLLGVTFCYHRLLSHKSFVVPKWIEYFCAYCGSLSSQSDPAEWVSFHRLHHVATDQVGDPHSPLQSAWWSHVGWLFDRAAVRVRLADAGVGTAGETSNVKDLLAQRFYVFMEATYELHLLASVVALYLLGGLPWVTWGYGLRTVVLWHATFAVNSVCHIWGAQPYETGDESRNNGVVAALAFGEGWHNNHHAFAYSARHGLEWWQLDATWLLIAGLEALGLATCVKLPTEGQKGKLRRVR